MKHEFANSVVNRIDPSGENWLDDLAKQITRQLNRISDELTTWLNNVNRTLTCALGLSGCCNRSSDNASGGGSRGFGGDSMDYSAQGVPAPRLPDVPWIVPWPDDPGNILYPDFTPPRPQPGPDSMVDEWRFWVVWLILQLLTSASNEPTQEADNFIWRGIESQIPRVRDFRPRAPRYEDDNIVDERDLHGLSFFRSRTNMWAQTLGTAEQHRRAYRVGFSDGELTGAGYSVYQDNVPPGHVSIRRINLEEWNAWLHAQPNTPDDRYSQELADLAKLLGRIEPNVAP